MIKPPRARLFCAVDARRRRPPRATRSLPRRSACTSCCSRPTSSSRTRGRSSTARRARSTCSPARRSRPRSESSSSRRRCGGRGRRVLCRWGGGCWRFARCVAVCRGAVGRFTRILSRRVASRRASRLGACVPGWMGSARRRRRLGSRTTRDHAQCDDPSARRGMARAVVGDASGRAHRARRSSSSSSSRVRS